MRENMRATRSNVQRLVLAVSAALALTGTVVTSAGAVGLPPLPTGNLVANGDEGPLASPTGNHIVQIVGWAKVGGSLADPTVVVYGAPGFPTVAQSAAMAAGKMFFAGGPPRAGDNNGPGFTNAVMYQTFALPADAYPYINGGVVQITISGCLGGYADQGDYAWMEGGAHGYGDDRLPSDMQTIGPGPGERGNQTELLPRSVTATLPAGASLYTITVYFNRLSGAATYNDGYADKIEAHLSYVGTDPPPANCTAPAVPGGPSGGGGGSTGGSPTTQSGASMSGTNSAVPLTRGSKRIVLTKHYALLKLHCAARDLACRGSVSLKTGATKLGSALFKIAVGKTATVKVKLGPKARSKLRHLSRRQLSKLKIKATATIGAQKTTFTLGASH
jgi:hypothetical protein